MPRTVTFMTSTAKSSRISARRDKPSNACSARRPGPLDRSWGRGTRPEPRVRPRGSGPRVRGRMDRAEAAGSARVRVGFATVAPSVPVAGHQDDPIRFFYGDAILDDRFDDAATNGCHHLGDGDVGIRDGNDLHVLGLTCGPDRIPNLGPLSRPEQRSRIVDPETNH